MLYLEYINLVFIMRKFVGLVNGKSFDNEKDFNDAANKAIKENDGSLSIASYYTYTPDNVEGDEFDDVKFVSTNEYFLGDRKPTKVEKLDSSRIGAIGYTNVEYGVSPELEERLKVATNKNSIKENINYHIEKLSNTIKEYRKDIEEIEKSIDNLQKKLYEQQESLLDSEGRRKYYNHILDIIESSESEKSKKDSDDLKDIKKTDNLEETKKIKKVLDVDPDTSLFTFLTQLGFFK